MSGTGFAHGKLPDSAMCMRSSGSSILSICTSLIRGAIPTFYRVARMGVSISCLLIQVTAWYSMLTGISQERLERANPAVTF